MLPPQITPVGLRLHDLYLAGWEIRLDESPIEEAIVNPGTPQQFTEARRLVELVIAKGDHQAIRFKVMEDVYDPDAVALLSSDIAAMKKMLAAD